MYLLITIRHNIFIQCHGNHIVVEKRLYYMLENDILRNYFPNKLGVLRGDFGVVWVSKRCPDAPCLQLQVPVISLKVNDILRNYFPKKLGVLRGDFGGGGWGGGGGGGVSKRCPDALLAKTMPASPSYVPKDFHWWVLVESSPSMMKSMYNWGGNDDVTGQSPLPPQLSSAGCQLKCFPWIMTLIIV